jgi:hypothetical protein
MPNKRWLSLTAALLLSAGCFHQAVQTGSAPGTTVVDKQYVATWLWGLVPAQEIDVRSQCPRGVATIATEQSFMNGLVGVLTLGIYTPQHVTVTCASSTASLPAHAPQFTVPAQATAAEASAVLRAAVERAGETGSPVILNF